MIKTYTLALTLMVLSLIGVTMSIPALAQSETKLNRAERIAFASFQNGQWDIFTVATDGSDLRQVTDDIYEDTDPAFSPDGSQLAYASRRQRNWDIYLLNLATGREIRLTTHPDYDAAPTWHPTGDLLTFQSYRSDDLDIWMIDLTANNALINLTVDSPAGEFDPAWADDGKTLFFTSWRAGNNDLWALNTISSTLTQLTSGESNDSQPAWDAAHNRLAFIRDTLGDKDIFLQTDALTATITQTNYLEQYSWLGSLHHPVFSPDGKDLVALWRRHNGMQLIRLVADSPIPVYLTDQIMLQGRLSWHAEAILSGTPLNTLHPPDNATLYTERVTPSESRSGEPYDLVRLNGVKTGSPWLADTVDDSYRALRNAVWREVGYDFLGELSEMLRPIDFFTDASQYSSWHKSGRAFDTLLDLPGQRLEIVRENIGGETYWRLFLRCADQVGGCGELITAKAWDYTPYARTQLSPEEGGVEKPNLYGYYVDFTKLAEQYGWERIASYDDEEFSWTWHLKAFEYWHYQKKLETQTGVSNWYQAMQQVYPQAEIDRFFTWEEMRANDEDPYLVVLKGVSVSLEVQAWWQALVIE